MGKKTKQMNDHDKTKGLIDTESKEAADRGGGKGKRDRRVRGVKMQTALWYMHNGILHSHRKGHI